MHCCMKFTFVCTVLLCFMVGNVFPSEIIQAVKNEEHLSEDNPYIYSTKDELDEELLKAAKNGLLNKVKLLINAGANVNTQNSDKKTPLMEAVTLGNKNIVEYLILKGADCNLQDKMGNTALSMAKLFHQTAIEEVLRNSGSNEGRRRDFLDTIGFWGLITGGILGVLIIIFLLRSFIFRSRKIGSAKNQFTNTELMHAVGKGHPNEVKILIQKSDNIDRLYSRGKTALFWALEKPCLNSAKLLLAC